jgi:hypothetical protein
MLVFNFLVFNFLEDHTQGLQAKIFSCFLKDNRELTNSFCNPFAALRTAWWMTWECYGTRWWLSMVPILRNISCCGWPSSVLGPARPSSTAI